MTQKPRWNVYALESPIDFWDGAVTYDDYLESVSADVGCRALAETMHSLALDEARQFGCGQLRTAEGPFVLVLPEPDQMRLAGFIFKADNNGDTFVVSDTPLPWLGSPRNA